MDKRIDSYYNFLKDKKIAFIGVGVSHIELIKLYSKKGFDVTICDKRKIEELEDKLVSIDLNKVKLCLGNNYLESLDNFDIIFRTPGMKFYTPELNNARKKGAVVTSEMEVFFDLCPCKIIAVTGSDGKTTTTTLISEFLKKQGYTVHLGGNIGRALLPTIEDVKPDDFAVVELSSFQLISMRTSPDISVVTNLQPNHLDMHKDMQEYIDSKKNIFLHQNAFSKTVLNFSNDITREFSELTRGDTWFFSRFEKTNRGAFLSDDGFLTVALDSTETKLFHYSDIRIPGMHNVENFLTAIAAVWGYVDIESIKYVAENFNGVEHRIEFVRELNGVKWYNDSIASSPSRAIAGLNSFSQRIILIAGGYDKHIPYEPLAPFVCEKVKTLILCGATAEKIATAVENCKIYNNKTLQIIKAKDIPDAVRIAHQTAKSGDIVSLSPASASFDFYPNFEVRGKHFKQLVMDL